jgi:hypothetical protein
MAYRWSAPLVALTLVGLLSAGACSPDGPDDPFDEADFQPGDGPDIGPPPAEVDLPDTRGVLLQPVPGQLELAVPVKVYGGDAELFGQVSGPAGQTGGGVVRLERFVGVESAVVEVPVAADGSWRARRLIGGRYRVRAYRSPDLAMLSSQVFFLPAENEVRLDLTVGRFGGIDVQAAFLASSIPVGASATVTALAQEIAVDADGIVRGTPLVGATITADGGAGWQIDDAARTVGADGTASWTVTCAEASPGDITISVNGGSTTVEAPCYQPAAAPVDPGPGDDQPIAVVEVGDRFTPPIDGPVGPGTYRVVESSGTCAFVYQPFVDGSWAAERRTASGTGDIVLDGFGRDLQPLGSTTPCTYERIS